jgi:hypothetical protein
MGGEGLTRRSVLRTAALATTVFTTPFVRGAATATVVPKGKLVLAWHTNIAARWLDPQQHDGTASPDNFIMALHDALIKNLREPRMPKAPPFGCGPGSSSTTDHRLPLTTSNGATSITGAPGGMCCTKERKESKSSTTVPFVFTSRNRFSIFWSCSARPMSVVRAGLSRRNTTRRPDNPSSRKSRLALVPTSSSPKSRVYGSTSRRSRATTAREDIELKGF